MGVWHDSFPLESTGRTLNFLALCGASCCQSLMASVRLKAGSANWFACFKVPTGKLDRKGMPVFRRQQISSGTTDKAKALQLAITYERAAVAAAEKRWSEIQAQRFLKAIEAVVDVRAGDTEPTEPFLRRWLNGRKKSLSPSGWQKYADAINAFVRYLDTRAGAPIADVTPRVVADFRDAETAKGKGPATVNKSLMVLGQAFDEAVTMQLLPQNPARGLNVKGEKRAAQKRSAFTFDQFRELVRVTAPDYVVPGRTTWKNHTLSPDWQTFILILGYTGGRQQEVAQMQWRHIDIAGKRITLHRTKTGDEHWLPLHPALAAHLAQRERGKPTDPVLPDIAKLQRRRISNKFRTAILPRIGIVQEYHSDGDAGRKLAAYSLHSLRHSLSTWLNAAGVSEMMRMRIVGHEDEDVSRGYTHTELEQAARELEKVPAV